MPPIDNLVAFTFAALLMNLAPGPSNLYVMARTISGGIAGGLASVAGLALGSLVHVVATVAGLSALIAYSPLAYTAVKVCGALYLIYLGLGYLLTNKNDAEVSLKAQNQSAAKILRESIIVEMTNPKTALFFLALLPQFVTPEAGPASTQLLVLGLIVTLSAIPCDLFVTFFANRTRNWIRSNPRAQQIQNRISGTLLSGLGFYILATEKP